MGGEFHAFTDYLTINGIIHRISCPHTHQQNSVVERKHGHIVEKGLTLLARASMPFKYWDESFRIVVFLHNRLPSPVSQGKYLLQLLFNHVLDYKALRIFGCARYPNTRPYNSHKLVVRSIQCTFLGYSLTHKSYKCLDSFDRIFISKDVIFYEDLFPFLESLSSQPQHSSTSQPLSFSQSAPILSSVQPASSISTTSSPTPFALIPHVNTATHLENCQDSNAPIVSSSIPNTVVNTHSMVTRSKKDIFKPKVYSVTKEP